MMNHEEHETVSTMENEALRRKLSEYFDNITGGPLCDAIENSISELASQDTIYQELEMEEDRLELEWAKVLAAMEKEQADVADRYVDVLARRGIKKTDLAYMAGVKDAVKMFRYLDLIKDR